jgi:DNA polymerase-3 subunit epsilon
MTQRSKLQDEIFICLDCEATGLEIASEEIIEIAVIKFNFQGIIEQFDTLVDPERPIPPESTAVHHITDDMVKGKPKIGDVLPKVIEMVGNHVVMGHNIGFDLNFIIDSAKKRNIPCNIDLQNSIDTVRLARLYGESASNKLEDLRKHFNIPEEGAHRALNDVVVNIQVFKYLAKSFRSTAEIMKRLREPILMKAMPLGKHKGKPFKELPIDYLHWASHQDFDQDLLFSLQDEKKKRKQRKPFLDSCNPFADL